MDIIEGHPIPQDITGFQFRIIGDLTIKQFAYLGIGLLLGWIAFAIPLPLIIKIPIIVLVVGTGLVFAFIPIQGRPADTMLMLFIRAVLRANEYSYEKQSQQMVKIANTPPVEKTQSGLPLEPTTPEVPPQHADVFQVHHTTPPPLPEAPVQEQPIDTVVQTLAAQLEEAKKEEGKEERLGNAKAAHEKTLELEKQLSNAQSEKQELEKQLLSLQQQLQQKNQQVFTPTAGKIPTPTEHVKTIPSALKKASGAPLSPEVPNLILGVVKDARGNVLPNVLIEVKDREGNPVRAFKTNQLGQFASATPLLNGTYVITFEDAKKQQQFDTIEITANGEIIEPLEVISADEREHLRKSLFGG